MALLPASAEDYAGAEELTRMARYVWCLLTHGEGNDRVSIFTDYSRLSVSEAPIHWTRFHVAQEKRGRFGEEAEACQIRAYFRSEKDQNSLGGWEGGEGVVL